MKTKSMNAFPPAWAAKKSVVPLTLTKYANNTHTP